MTIQERIKQIEDWINDICGFHACNGTFVKVYEEHGKIVISTFKNRYFIRERKVGRGIQAMRIANHLGFTKIVDKTLIIGKNHE